MKIKYIIGKVERETKSGAIVPAWGVYDAADMYEFDRFNTRREAAEWVGRAVQVALLATQYSVTIE